MWNQPAGRQPHFHLFGTPVTIHGSFYFLALFLGWGALQHFGVSGLLLIVLAVTLSLLIHEFGHVYAAHTNGYRSQVMLLGFGGVTIPEGQARGWRAIWMSAAGPMAGLSFWALIWFGFMLTGGRDWGSAFDPMAWFDPRSVYDEASRRGHDSSYLWFWTHLCWMNLFLSLLNLAPVFPLDGGHILHDGLKMRMRSIQAQRVSAAIGIVVAISAAIGLYLWSGQILPLLIFGMLAWQNWERWQEST